MTTKFTEIYSLMAALLIVCAAGGLCAQEVPEHVVLQRDGWQQNIEVAKKLAVREGKDLLIEFTRAKGCGWCLKLEKEVISKNEFKEKVAKDFILVVLNYPHDRSKRSAELKAKYDDLQRYYQVHRFPSIVFADAGGRPYEMLSYRERKPRSYLKDISAIQGKRNRRDAAFKAANSEAGAAKARLLEKGLADLKRGYHRYYPEILAKIAEADPEDGSGFMAKVRVDEVRVGLGELLRSHYEAKDYEAVAGAVEFYIIENRPKGEALQMALLYKIQALYSAKHYTSAKKVSDEVISINGASRAAHYASLLKKRMELLSSEGK